MHIPPRLEFLLDNMCCSGTSSSSLPSSLCFFPLESRALGPGHAWGPASRKGDADAKQILPLKMAAALLVSQHQKWEHGWQRAPGTPASSVDPFLPASCWRTLPSFLSTFSLPPSCLFLESSPPKTSQRIEPRSPELFLLPFYLSLRK